MKNLCNGETFTVLSGDEKVEVTNCGDAPTDIRITAEHEENVTLYVNGNPWSKETQVCIYTSRLASVVEVFLSPEPILDYVWEEVVQDAEAYSEAKLQETGGNSKVQGIQYVRDYLLEKFEGLMIAENWLAA